MTATLHNIRRRPVGAVYACAVKACPQYGRNYLGLTPDVVRSIRGEGERCNVCGVTARVVLLVRLQPPAKDGAA